MPEYRDCPGFPGYRVGDDGSVWSCWVLQRLGRGYGTRAMISHLWHRLKPKPVCKWGHLKVNLYPGHRQRLVHRLVLEAFVGPCPPGMECWHDPDPDPTNNALCNLRWDTSAANSRDMVKHGRCYKKPVRA